MSRKDVHAKALEGLDDDEDAPAKPVLSAPKTFIGSEGEALKKGFKARIDELEALLASADRVVELDPARVRRTAFTNRDARSFDAKDPDFAALVDSVARTGNIIPIEVRRAPADSGVDYEIVSGHRRHAACLALATKVRAVVVAVDDDQLLEHMNQENDVRKDPSWFEYGLHYKALLKRYGTQKAIAERVHVNEQRISTCIAIAELPVEILSAFGDPRQITQRNYLNLAGAIKARRDEVHANARELVSRGVVLSADGVVAELVKPRSPGGSKAAAFKPYEQTIRLGDNKTVFSKLKAKGPTCVVALGSTVKDPKLRERLVAEIEAAIHRVREEWEQKRG